MRTEDAFSEVMGDGRGSVWPEQWWRLNAGSSQGLSVFLTDMHARGLWNLRLTELGQPAEWEVCASAPGVQEERFVCGRAGRDWLLAHWPVAWREQSGAAAVIGALYLYS